MNMKKFSAVLSALDNLTAFAVKLSEALRCRKIIWKKATVFSAVLSTSDNLTTFAVKLSEALHCRKIIWKKVKVFSVALSTAENILQILKLLYRSDCFYIALQKNTGASEKTIILTTFSTD